ncbi:MAG TPA: GNAT family N-acetyltransferase [Polyangia bacterium]|nr:GNAT family N-acetyltransferase [Polyangia bacterium]
MLGSGIIELEIVDSVTAVAAADWNRLAGEDDPFLEHAFLAALEASDSVGPRAGCEPRFVVAREAGRLVGAVPLYLKTNSYGEFIFDWSWANAAHRSGVRYYPKLVAAIPFTPATGYRLPIWDGQGAPGVDRAAVAAALLRGTREVADAEKASSIHFLFCTEPEKQALAQSGYVPRLSMQFHWHNRPGRPFESFDDYLSTFRSQNRKQVRKERRVAAEHGLTFRTATGAELEPRDWKALRAFYVENVDRHGGHAYLSAQFFEVARETLADRWVSTLAYQGTKPVAGTIGFEKGAHLYGRYWGCLADFQMLHFELCYYQLIDRAIARRQTLFEAGAQGEHKLKRGLGPAFTHSAHWIRHPGLRDAIGSFVVREAEAVEAEVREYAAHAPFRNAGEPEPGDRGAPE